jgi:myo-inositol-1(or 4)-monophosphatase
MKNANSSRFPFRSFAFGMRLSAVSIGVYRLMDQKLIIAVIYDPFADEMFSSCLGRGSFLNGDRISVGNQKKLDESIVASGAPPNPCNLAPCMRGLVALAPHVSTTRMLGSAAIMLAYVACGRLTVYWETDLNSWDTAAGALLILEAGGMVTDGDGLPYTITTRPIIASNGEPVHSQVIDILKSVRALATDEDPIMPTLYNSKFYEPKK